MILESVTLDNIRSYTEPTTIPLPTGHTLFRGDIGSGKSSILSAVEFALFGLGDVDGRYLLNSKSTRGSVILEFRMGEKKYRVYRELVREKKAVVQSDGYIAEDGNKTSYSVTGMRTRILDIIGIRERPHAKTTSLIYRSAIFSPQEMMKEILTEDSGRRFDTLRRAFGIEDYSTASKNSEVIDRWASVETKLSAQTSINLSQKKSALEKESESLSRLSSESDPLQSALEEIELGIEAVGQKIAGLKEQRDKVLRLEASIPILQSRLEDSKGSLAEQRRRASRLKAELSEIERAEKQVGELGQRYAEYSQEKQELESLEPISEDYSKNENEKQRLKVSLNEKTQRLQSEIAARTEEIAADELELKKDLEQIRPLEELKAKRNTLKKNLTGLIKTRKKADELRAAAEKLKSEKSPLQNELKSSKEEMDGILKIGVGAPCPKCKRPLSEDHIHQLKKDYTKKSAAIRRQISELQTRLTKTNIELKSVEGKVTSLEKDERELKVVEPRLSALTEKAESVKRAESHLAAKRQKLEASLEVFKRKEFAVEERRALESLEKLLREQEPGAVRYAELKKKVQAAEKAQVQSIFLQADAKVRRRPQLDEELKSLDTLITSAEESLVKQEHELEDTRAQYSREKPILKEISSFEKDLVKLNAEKDEKTKKLVTLTANLDNARERIASLTEEVKKMEDANRRKVYFEQFRNWLDTCFVPAVGEIEMNTLATVREQFNLELQKWFRILIESEDIEVQVDETFTPIVTQGGYGLDVNSLSGGERTSVALAYRLALNVTARAAIGLEPDLLILDEPTDGFSSVQLTKLNQVLEGLRTAQVIMVSHERELETYVDHVCSVVKEGGVSRVQYVRP